MNTTEETIPVPMDKLARLIMDSNELRIVAKDNQDVYEEINSLRTKLAEAEAERTNLVAENARLAAERMQFLKNWRDLVRFLQKYQSVVHTVATASPNEKARSIRCYAGAQWREMQDEAAKIDAMCMDKAEEWFKEVRDEGHPHS